MRKNPTEKALVEFVAKTTEAITVISKSTEQMNGTLNALKDHQIEMDNRLNTKIDSANVKLNGLRSLFLYVIVPLITGILALVGVKLAFKLP
ncbi:MAG: hypothetical protein ACTSYW_10545 [Candidatus Heimdallarchaeota archaeon]